MKIRDNGWSELPIDKQAITSKEVIREFNGVKWVYRQTHIHSKNDFVSVQETIRIFKEVAAEHDIEILINDHCYDILGREMQHDKDWVGIWSREDKPKPYLNPIWNETYQRRGYDYSGRKI